jgi:hypothetical protein
VLTLCPRPVEVMKVFSNYELKIRVTIENRNVEIFGFNLVCGS